MRINEIKYFYKIASYQLYPEDERRNILEKIRKKYYNMTCDKSNKLVSLGYMSPDGIFYDLRVLQEQSPLRSDNLSQKTIDRFFQLDFGHDSFAIEFFSDLLPKKSIVSGIKHSDGSFSFFTKKELFKRSGWVILNTTRNIGLKSSWYDLFTKKTENADITEEEKVGIKNLILYINGCAGVATPINIYNYENNENSVVSLISFSIDDPGIADNLLYENRVFDDKTRDELEKRLYSDMTFSENKNLVETPKRDIYYGYKIVAKNKNGELYSLQNPNVIYDFKVGKYNYAGMYLGTTKEFVLDYYTDLTDDEDVLVTFVYEKEDLMRGDPLDQVGAEVIVSGATVYSIESI